MTGGVLNGNAADEHLLHRVRLVMEATVFSSVLAAQVAHMALRPGGLLVLRGASAALGPTPWGLPYGTSRVAVHHLVRSLAAEGSGMPAGCKTIAIAPYILDSPQNRMAMPDADRSTWPTPQEIGHQVEAWCSHQEPVENGKVYIIRKKDGQPARFEPHAPF